MPLPTINLEALKALPPRERAEAEEQLRALEAHSKANPLYYWTPYEKQATYLGVPRVPLGVKLLAGGNRAGKTEVGVVDDLIQALPRELLSPTLAKFKQWDRFRCRVVSPSYKQQSTVILEKFRNLCP